MKEAYSMYSFLLDRTARSVKQYAQKRFKELGFNITVDQWLILRQLHDNVTLNQKEISEMVFKDTPTVTRIIDLLCEKGLTERRVHSEDRRCFHVFLTQRGREKVAYIRPQVRTIRLKAWEGLSGKDFEDFQRILNTINLNLRGQENENSKVLTVTKQDTAL